MKLYVLRVGATKVPYGQFYGGTMAGSGSGGMAAVDGLLLHRGLGTGPHAEPVTAVPRRLVS